MKKSVFSCLHSYSLLTTAIFKAAVFFCVAACNLFYSKENYLKNFEQFVTQTKNNYVNYTQNDWEKTDLE